LTAGFSTWLASKIFPNSPFPILFREQKTYCGLVNGTEEYYNHSVTIETSEMTINYDQNVDYGYEVNYLIYNYMVYFQNTFKQKTFGYVPQDNVTIFVIIIIKNEELKKRWKIESNFQLAIIFIVFDNRFYFGLVIKTRLFWLGIMKEDFGFVHTVRLLIIFPLYQVLLVLIGSLLGQFKFFWVLKKNASKNGIGFLLSNKQT
jgi:hypothetical protein